MNSVKLFGRLTKEPTIRTKEQDGKTSVTAYVTLAVQRPWKNSVGEYEADFPNIVFYKSGDFIQKYLHKGDRCIVEGRIRTFMTNENGQNIKHLQIVGNNVTLVDYHREPEPIPAAPEDIAANEYRELLPEGFEDQDVDDF